MKSPLLSVFVRVVLIGISNILYALKKDKRTREKISRRVADRNGEVLRELPTRNELFERFPFLILIVLQ